MYTNDEFYENVLLLLNSLRIMKFENLSPSFQARRILRNEYDETFKKNFSIIFTTPNGNCLYNAISTCLIGDESLSTILRLLVVYAFKKNYSFFHNIVTQFEAYSLNFYASEAAREFTWGRDIHLYALSLVLERPICTFHGYDFRSTSNGLKFNASRLNGKSPIYLSFANKNHWEAIVPNAQDSPNIVPSKSLYNEEFSFSS